MNAWTSLFASIFIVVLLAVAAALGAGANGLESLFGIWIPYVAGAIFIGGVLYRLYEWAKIPVPFRIPTTGGQGRSLPWIKASYTDSPWTTTGVVLRMALEVLLFRSLFRNTRAELHEGPKAAYGSTKWLWLFGILFHYSFLVIVIRHMRFFIEPVPSLVELISSVDGFFQILLPTLFLTDLAFLGAATWLFLRRIIAPQVRYISLPADYFPLALLLGIAISGVLMRNVYKVDISAVKQLALGLFTLSPAIPGSIGSIFYVHLFLVSVLIAYLPFSKIMHAGGVFLSPTRNLASNNRAEHYESEWTTRQVKFHTYEEYENEFREKMKDAGIPVDKE